MTRCFLWPLTLAMDCGVAVTSASRFLAVAFPHRHSGCRCREGRRCSAPQCHVRRGIETRRVHVRNKVTPQPVPVPSTGDLEERCGVVRGACLFVCMNACNGGVG